MNDHLAQKALKIHAILKKEYPNPRTELVFKHPYELLFAVIMSAQTTDKQVNKVTEQLFQKYKTLDDYINTSQEDFQNDIRNIGLYRNKAKNILATAKILKEKYNGQVPKTMPELIELPGVARKTSNVVLSELYGIQEGIAVDTHVTRLSQQLGLTTHTDAVKIERDLMALIPKEDWGGFSHRLIMYGRYQWTARDKDHSGPLAEFAVPDQGGLLQKKK